MYIKLKFFPWTTGCDVSKGTTRYVVMALSFVDRFLVVVPYHVTPDLCCTLIHCNICRKEWATKRKKNDSCRIHLAFLMFLVYFSHVLFILFSILLRSLDRHDFFNCFKTFMSNFSFGVLHWYCIPLYSLLVLLASVWIRIHLHFHDYIEQWDTNRENNGSGHIPFEVLSHSYHIPLTFV